MQDIYKQAVAMQFKFRDYRDDKAHPLNRQLETEIQRLVDEIEMQKNPRTLEDRVRQLIRVLEGVDGSPAISNQHVDDLKDRCERIRDDLRKLM
jgi:hypothetical protein